MLFANKDLIYNPSKIQQRYLHQLLFQKYFSALSVRSNRMQGMQR